MKHLILFAIFLVFAFFVKCKKDEPNSLNIQYGKNTFALKVDGIDRNYIVSVPQGYDGKTNLPVVFMLHGTGGDGEKFYNISGWKELGEQENVFTVFPSALSNCIHDEDGIQKNTSKWNSQPANNWSYCSSVAPPDDIKFLKQVITELDKSYSINTKQIYFVGFSNGGQMCSKLSILMGDRIAAIVESASSFDIDTTYIPIRKMPITFQIGNGDYGSGNTGPLIPLSEFPSVIASSNNKPYRAIQTHIKSFDLNPNYIVSGDTNTVVIATYTPNNGSVTNNFNFAFINGLTHQYPNGTNHWMHGAQVHWDWLKQFSLP